MYEALRLTSLEVYEVSQWIRPTFHLFKSGPQRLRDVRILSLVLQKGHSLILDTVEQARFLIIWLGMYGLYDSLWANYLDFACFLLVQITIPAIVLVTTPKGSPLRYITIPVLTWIASRFIRPFAPAGSPTWCQAICVFVLVTLQALDLLLIRPLDRYDISQITKVPNSLKSSVFASAKLLVQTRSVNTPWQVKNVPAHPLYFSRRGTQHPQRSLFLIRQAAILFWQYLFLDIIQAIIVQNAPLQSMPSSGPRWNLSFAEWAEKGSTYLVIWFIINRVIGDSAYRLLSIIFVGFGIDSPADWPPAFGSMSDSYTLRNFWGKFWHQFMRRPFTSPANFITRDILRLPRSSLLERYTSLFFVFLCSSLYHVIVDLLQSVPVEHSGSFPFFMAFVPAIIFEDGIQWLWRRLTQCRDQSTISQSAQPPLWQRALGFVWVLGWMAVTSNWYFTPMIQLTNQDAYMVPFSFSQRFGLIPVATSSFCSGILLYYLFEIEL